MRACEWAVAANFRTPVAYDIPELPAWRVCREECGGLAFAAADGDPFITADNPMKVRR